MPRRSVLSSVEWENLLAVPVAEEDLVRAYTFTSEELALIGVRRGAANRLGFGVQLAYMRYPGVALGMGVPERTVVDIVASQVRVAATEWELYGVRGTTRREHALELQAALGLRTFTDEISGTLVESLEEIAAQTTKPVVVATAAVEQLRVWGVLLPSASVLDKVAAEAITRGDRRVYAALTDSLTAQHRRGLDGLLSATGQDGGTRLGWLRQSPKKPNSKSMREHIERLQRWRELELPVEVGFAVHQNRLLKLAREGAQMTAGDLAKFEPQRRYATLAALAVESQATVTDEIIDLHDRILGKMFNAAKNRHRNQFHDAGKDINDKVRLYGRIGELLVTARENGEDPFDAIDEAIGWDAFIVSVNEAQALARPKDFDFLPGVRENFTMLRRYSPQFLDTLVLRAAPSAEDLLEAVKVLRAMNASSARTLPELVPTGFVRKRWARVVFTPDGIDRTYYELCVLAEVRNSLRSGDLWVEGSRQFKDFEEYLLPSAAFGRLAVDGAIPLPIEPDCENYLQARFGLLESHLATVSALADADELDGVTITATSLKIAPAETIVPEAAQALIRKASAMMPRIPITDMLLEANGWTGVTDCFTHLKTGDPARDTTLLMTAVLADGINLGLTKMAESCAGATYAKMLRTQAMHIRDETYSAALATIVNAQNQHPFAAHWGDGTTSSSDGQRFKTGNRAESTGHINPKYGSAPGRLIYTHISDQYAPFHATLVNVGVRDATYVLDGLLHHESDLRITEHYTDTAGFTDHVFALTHLLGFRFSPRIRDLAETRIYLPAGSAHPTLNALIGGTINTKHIRNHWNEILRLASSIKTGTVTASLMLRKLGAYPRQNGLALALRELGRLERSIFILEWLQSPDLRRRTTAGLNKGEAKNALSRAVFFNRLGEIRDRSYEQQRYRAGGLTLLTAIIVLWNTVYLERVINALQEQDPSIDPDLFQHLSPLGWELSCREDFGQRN